MGTSSVLDTRYLHPHSGGTGHQEAGRRPRLRRSLVQRLLSNLLRRAPFRALDGRGCGFRHEHGPSSSDSPRGYLPPSRSHMSTETLSAVVSAARPVTATGSRRISGLTPVGGGLPNPQSCHYLSRKEYLAGMSRFARRSNRYACHLSTYYVSGFTKNVVLRIRVIADIS